MKRDRLRELALDCDRLLRLRRQVVFVSGLRGADHHRTGALSVTLAPGESVTGESAARGGGDAERLPELRRAGYVDRDGPAPLSRLSALPVAEPE